MTPRQSPVAYRIGAKRHIFLGDRTPCGIRWEAVKFKAYSPTENINPGEGCRKCMKKYDPR